MGAMHTIARPDGHEIDCYVAIPTIGKTAPVVIVIQEWWGLNDQIKAMGDKVAAAGYVAVVPDLYHGKLATDADEAGHLMQNLDWGHAVQDVGAILAHYRAADQQVAITGFCMGGAITFLAASKLPDFACAVPYYGIPGGGDLSQIKVPLQAHWAEHDDWCNAAAIAGVEEQLKSGGVSFEFYRYDAHHAFMNQARPEVYNAEVADLAWTRTMEFMAKHLE